MYCVNIKTPVDLRNWGQWLAGLILPFILGACSGSGDAAKSYTVGGILSGLNEGQQIALANGDDRLTIVANGPFNFQGLVPSGSTYNIVITTQPVGQTCVLAGGSGVVAAMVSSVSISCTTNTFSIGGSVSGLMPPFTLSLVNNQNETLELAADGAFTFSQKISYGASYSVTVGAEPAGQSCVIIAGSGSVTETITTVQVECSPNVDFVEIAGAFSNPLAIYDYVDPIQDPPGTAGVLYSEAVDIDQDEINEIIFVMGKGWGNQIETRPARARVVIMKLNESYVFEDITHDILSNTNSLPGFPSEAKVADVNDDGRPDLLISLNQDDGRQGGAEGSIDSAPLAVMLSQSDSRYLLKTFGDQKFWQTINVGRDAAGQTFVMGGGGFTVPNDVYQFSGDNTITRLSGVAPDVNPHIIEFSSPSPNSPSETLIGVESDNLLGVTAWTKAADGGWSRIGRLSAPYPKVGTIQIRTWTGSLATPDLLKDGDDYIVGQGSGISISKSCQIRITPSSAKQPLMLLPRLTLPEYIAGKIYDDAELIFGASLIGAKVSGGILEQANPIISDQEIAGVNAIEMDCKDINHDSYDDIVIYGMRRGTGNSAPIVYLNKKDGTFQRSDFATRILMAPDNPVDLETQLLADLDGDGISDIIIFPSSPPVPSLAGTAGFAGTMKFFKGMRTLKL